MAYESRTITKKDWQNVLNTMHQYNRYSGYVDFTREGLFRFFDTDPRINGVRACSVTIEDVKHYLDYAKE